MLLDAFLLGESAAADREEDVPLGVLVPDGLLPDEPAPDLPADFSVDAPSPFVVLGLGTKTIQLTRSNM